MVGDKGYSSRKVRHYLARRGIQPVIARRSNEPQQRDFDAACYRQRTCVERLINRLKHFRRVATRYEKLAENYLAMVTLAAILLWLSPIALMPRIHTMPQSGSLFDRVGVMLLVLS